MGEHRGVGLEDENLPVGQHGEINTAVVEIELAANRDDRLQCPLAERGGGVLQ
jgi:hypothetical protein